MQIAVTASSPVTDTRALKSPAWTARIATSRGSRLAPQGQVPCCSAECCPAEWRPDLASAGLAWPTVGGVLSTESLLVRQAAEQTVPGPAPSGWRMQRRPADLRAERAASLGRAQPAEQPPIRGYRRPPGQRPGIGFSSRLAGTREPGRRPGHRRPCRYAGWLARPGAAIGPD